MTNMKHRVENILAATAVTYGVFKLDKNSIQKVVDGFKGVEYRLEEVGEKKDIKFINDTTATIPDAAIGNIESFKKKVILITGGADKNLDFTEFGKVIAGNSKEVILLPGTATKKIKEEIEKNNPKFELIEVKSMARAVKKAYEKAKPNDVILLSPGCASFGIFKNEFDRGDQFNEEVKKIINPRQ